MMKHDQKNHQIIEAQDFKQENLEDNENINQVNKAEMIVSNSIKDAEIEVQNSVESENNNVQFYKTPKRVEYEVIDELDINILNYKYLYKITGECEGQAKDISMGLDN